MTRLGVVTPRRGIHILDGDGDGIGGGHRWDSETPGKTKFPRSWKDDKILASVEDVAKRPDQPPERFENGRWQCIGTRDEVEIMVILDEDGSVRTARPRQGPGVVKNPR